MAELKTRANPASVEAFLRRAAGEKRLEDCRTLVRLMKQATKSEPRMWGPSIVGFGNRPYVYPDGRTMDWFILGFSPRKQDLTLYLMGGLERHAKLLAKLGPYRRGKGCLYVKRLADVDLAILERMIRDSVKVARSAKS